ncbi:MAG: type III ribulose-bisphosphate carboxylase [Candidatus Micrarchaeota archaeon]|nr:type III ribulose-bisphosphate carboxylase [Candidatus Micrarchaeota archaeon]
MRYEDFVDTAYQPGKDELICDFYVESTMPIKKAAGGIAAESSIGTWTELTTVKDYMRKLAATVFYIKKSGEGYRVKISYPPELFEAGSMPNILSSIAGNIFGLKELVNLRLNDIHFPRKLARSFPGPKYGIPGVRRILGVRKRPLIGTIVKPKLGLRTKDHAEVAYKAWVGGCDIVKDDENLGSQKFNPFRKRFLETIKKRDKAESETGERKMYMVNVTCETEEMKRRAKFVADNGGEYVMVDILTVGWAALQTLRDLDLGLVLHAHRAGHAALTKNPKHGISMKVIARVTRLIGLDQLHVGTVVGKMFEGKKDVLENCAALKEDFYGIKKVFPVASGGLHPLSVPELVKIFGTDVIIQSGGGIHGHPMGTVAGAKAMRQALDAVLSGMSLKEYAKTHEELRVAIERFGR